MNDGAATPHDQYSQPDVREPLCRQTLTVEEFAVLAGIGRSTAYEAARRGEIPARRIGTRYVTVVLARAWLGELDIAEDPVPAHWRRSENRDDQAESVPNGS